VQDGSHMARTQLSYVSLRCVACLRFVHAAQEPSAQQPTRKAHCLPSTINTQCYVCWVHLNDVGVLSESVLQRPEAPLPDRQRLFTCEAASTPCQSHAWWQEGQQVVVRSSLTVRWLVVRALNLQAGGSVTQMRESALLSTAVWYVNHVKYSKAST
jgi:hypothetical protein